MKIMHFCVTFGEKSYCQRPRLYLKWPFIEVCSWEGEIIMQYSVKKKVTTLASVAAISLLMAACGAEAPDQAAEIEETMQEGTEAAGEAIGGAAGSAEELVKSQADSVEGAVDEAGDAAGERVEQPASYDGAADQVEEAAGDENLEDTLDEAKQRLDSAKEEIEGAQE